MENHTFNWIEPDDLALARSRLHRELSESAANPNFKVRAERLFSINNQKCQLVGRADIVVAMSNSGGNNITGVKSIWEIKFISQLSNQHVIQACTYTYLLKLPHIILYNIRNGQK